MHLVGFIIRICYSVSTFNGYWVVCIVCVIPRVVFDVGTRILITIRFNDA